MADTMTCPLCHQEHPAGTTWCPTLFQDISHLLQTAAPAEPPLPPAPSPPPPSDETGQVECPECGALGRPGESCPQCTQIIPAPVPIHLEQVYLVLPSLRAVAIPRGQEIILGRQSDLADVRAGLEPFDGVSRQHCYLTIASDRDIATIRDPKSLNRTWVGDNEREIGENERREVALPVRIRLGQTAYLTITPEGTA